MSTYERTEPVPLASQPPPEHAVVMPAVAEAVGVSVDVVDSGAGAEFTQPELAVRAHGPIANALDGRLTGSSSQVHDAARQMNRAAEPVVDERVEGR